MQDIIIKKINSFVQARNWEQYHTSSELARALNIEASELSELYLWGKTPSSERLREELADVLIYALMLADKNDININTAILEKIKKNAKKYPVQDFKGTNKKYK